MSLPDFSTPRPLGPQGGDLLGLNDGRRMPRLGLGVWRVPPAETARVVLDALEVGYRLIDTASIYGNEAEVGAALAETGIPRRDIFVTTKLWKTDHGFSNTLRAFDESLGKLRLDYVDLYLIHWPMPHLDLYAETWRALIKLREDGRARSIGVSNFTPMHIDRIVGDTGVVPTLNQIELHPYLQQRESRSAHDARGIVTQSWSPLGQSQAFDEPLIRQLSHRHGRTPAQIILRWHLDSGLAVLTRSSSRARLQENFEALNFRLSPDDIAAMSSLDRNARNGPHPDDFV